MKDYLIGCDLPGFKQQYAYQVLSYVIGMPELLLSAQNIETGAFRHYRLRSPNYFVGPMKWHGTGLYEGTEKELTAFTHKWHPYYDERQHQFFVNEHILLKSKIEGTNEVKMIVSSISKIEQIRPERYPFAKIAD